MAKKAAAKKRPAKKADAKGSPPGQLGDWLDEVPDNVQELADKYDAAHRAKAKATSAFNTARDGLIEAMREAGCKRVRVRSGDKLVVLSDEWKVTLEQPKDDKGADGVPY
jgi:hypothetical protein